MADVKKTKSEVFEKLGLEENNSGVLTDRWENFNGLDAINVVSPIDGSFLARVSVATDEEYERAVKSLQKAFEEWREIPGPKRSNLIRKISDGLVSYKKDIGKIVSLEVGKTNIEGQGEIQEMIDVGYFATGLGRQLYGNTIASEREDHILYEKFLPLGIVGVITSFNFPAAVWSWNSFVAATTGDTVLWKPSSKAPLTSVAVMRIIQDIVEQESMPDIFSLINGRGSKIGDRLARDRRIPLVSFTGSVKTGRHISEVVSQRFGKSILELGGNNCAIVSDNSDLEMALKGVGFGALATAGQRCTSTRRAVINDKIYDTFASRLVEAYKKATVGNPLDDGILVGPLIDEAAVDTFQKAIIRIGNEGGKILYGGKVLNTVKGGNYVQPTIIEATPDMPITKEETFAPILYLFRYKTLEEAIKIHNSVPQGLSSAIFTNDLREEEIFLSAKGSDCGIANVNTSTAGAEIGGAFGGEKDTGGGRESGSDAWRAYTRRITITKNYGRNLPLAQGVVFEL
ncbi:MAG: aldehyde dehydrogenase family protein [Ferroplasma sp.]